MTPSKILFLFCLAFILGVFVESLIKIPQVFLAGFLLLDVAFLFIFIKKNNFLVAGFCILFLIIGILRVQIAEFNIANNRLAKFNGKGEIVFTGTIIDEPDVRDASQKLKIKVGDGIVLATANKYPEYKYLDKVKVTGKLQEPDIIDGFNYKNYLLKDGIYSVISFAKIEVIGKANAGLFENFYSRILFIKQKFRQSIKQNYTPPASLILQGTIVGDNGVLSQDLKDKLNITGLRHIIAVSGTHIVILSSILIYLLLYLGFWRKDAIILSIAIIWFYIILTGLSASGLRAGIMGSAIFASQIFGRQNSSQRMMALAGALMLLQNPLLLFYDAGFQLSFLAAMGIVYLNPILEKFMPGIIATTFSAQIFTIPLMMYNFGNVSLVAPITNLLILPIVEPLMIFGFISSFAGIFSNMLGFVLSLPCQILLLYFSKVIDIFSKPYMAIFFENVHWLWLVVLYSIIGTATYFLNKRASF